MTHFIHGSEDSLDVDVFFVIENLHQLTQDEQKKLCVQLSTEHGPTSNGNLISIKDGFVDFVYKGTVDEVNNSLLATYHLHEQEFPLPIAGTLPRDKVLKALRTIRGILSHCSRTQYREMVKKALNSKSLTDRLEAACHIRFAEIADFGKNPAIEVYKFMAFQLAQILGLILEDKEIYTKSQAATFFKTRSRVLAKMLYREEVIQADAAAIDRHIALLVQSLPTIIDFEKAADFDFDAIPTPAGLLSVKHEKYIN
jgi:hypothetical protein